MAPTCAWTNFDVNRRRGLDRDQCRQAERPQQIRPKRLALFHSGRVEVVFGDASACVLHPPHAERATYFRADGTRQRLLTSCAPRLCTAGGQRLVDEQVRAKIASALELRGLFHDVASPHQLDPCLAAASQDQRVWWHQRFCHVHWQCGKGQCPAKLLPTADGSPGGHIVVESVDGMAKLTLAPHAQTYSVEWWCATDEPCSVQHKSLPAAPSEVACVGEAGSSGKKSPAGQSGAPSFRKMDGPQRLFVAPRHASGGIAVSVKYEHVRQIQFLSTRDPPPAAWSYPLLQALLFRREVDPTCAVAQDQLLAWVEATLEEHVAGGRVIVLESMHEIRASLPLAEFGTARTDVCIAWSKDEVSPASAFGAGGEGSIHVVWTPTATTWLHFGRGDQRDFATCGSEVTLDVTQSHTEDDETTNELERSDHRIVFVSSRGGRFWTQLGKRGQLVQTMCTAVLPLDSASATLSAQMSEALQWLEHNRAEEAAAVHAGTRSSQKRSPSWCIREQRRQACLLEVEELSGWVLEKEAVETSVCRLSVLRLAGIDGLAAVQDTSVAASRVRRRLVRALFVDGARIEFFVQAAANGRSIVMPTDVDSFRFLSPAGEIAGRSFGAPFGCDAYVDVVRTLLATAAVDEDAQRQKRIAEKETSALVMLFAGRERRRGASILMQHGVTLASLADAIPVGTSLGCTGVSTSDADRTPSPHPGCANGIGQDCVGEDIVGQALWRTRQARLGIEQALSTTSLYQKL